jgi:SAM-dependent methyltransferase
MFQDLTEKEMLVSLRRIFPSISWSMDELTPFLKAVGIMSPNGRLYAEREKKLYEVISFSNHVAMCVDRISRTRDTVILDCGCGRSYLPFFLNLVLREKRRNVAYIGVDANAKLVEKSSEIAKALGYGNMEFHASSIIGFEPKEVPNIVCALHACDTATDEAIAKGVGLNARFVVVAPCCQRQVVRQVGKASMKVSEIRPFVDSKVAKEYVGVALTETLRRLALESFGFKVDMFEFVSLEYTPKNVMLRAEKIRGWTTKSINEYRSLRDYFNIKPKIEEYLPQLK